MVPKVGCRSRSGGDGLKEACRRQRNPGRLGDLMIDRASRAMKDTAWLTPQFIPAIRRFSGIIRIISRFPMVPAAMRSDEVSCVFDPLRLKARSHRKNQAMAHNYAINDDVHHQLQGPQGRAVVKQRSIYTIVTCLPIEADGRPRYRIKSKTENVERVVTEEQISRLG
jgi:hypothetical protein